MEKSLLGKVNDFLNMEIPIPFKAKGKNDNSLLEAIKQNTQQDDPDDTTVEANLENTDAANEIMETIEDSDIHELEDSISFETDDDTFDLTESSSQESGEWGGSSWGNDSWGNESSTEDSTFGSESPFGSDDAANTSITENVGNPHIHHNEGGNNYDMDIPEEELRLQELLSTNVLVEMEKEIMEFAEFELDPIVYERYAELEYRRYQPKSYFLIPIDYSDY